MQIEHKAKDKAMGAVLGNQHVAGIHKKDGLINNKYRTAKTISTGPLVSSIAEFRELRDRIATKPFGAAACFIQALLNYCSEDEAKHNEGCAMVTISLWEDSIVHSGEGYMGYSIHSSDVDRLARVVHPRDYIVRSYVSGSSKDNGYSIVNVNEISIDIRPQWENAGSEREGRMKVFIWSSGADTARPITLKRNDKGIWKVSEFSSLTLDIPPPAALGPSASDVL